MDTRPGKLARVRQAPTDELEERATPGDQDAAGSPEALREQIARTRADLAGTVDAIQEKLDPQHLKQRAQEEIRAATIGRVEPRLEQAQRQARAAASTIGGKAAAISDAIGISTEEVRAQVRGRVREATQTVAAIASRTHVGSAQDTQPTSDGATLPGGRMKALPGSIALALDAGVHQARPFAHALARRIRAYPMTACMVALGVGLALGRALAPDRYPPDDLLPGLPDAAASSPDQRSIVDVEHREESHGSTTTTE